MKFIARMAAGCVVLCACAGPGQVTTQLQNAPDDPQAVVDELLRAAMEEAKARRAEREKDRVEKQKEEAYDRAMCVKVGYRGPDIDQCVRDSAVWRRGARPGQAQPPGVNCVTVDVGGMLDTTCQ